jgi:hypothetical protein
LRDAGLVPRPRVFVFMTKQSHNRLLHAREISNYFH